MMVAKCFIVLVVITSTVFTMCNCDKRAVESTLFDSVTGIEFIRVHKGEFLMGDPSLDSGRSSDNGCHRVILPNDFWMSRTEVTLSQWQKVMGCGELHPEKPNPFRNFDPDLPVVSVSYNDIQIFMEKLNSESTEFYYRLPTEAEWEYACRAGTSANFSYGDIITSGDACYNAEFPSEYSLPGKSFSQPMPAGSFPPNQWGLCDMHGNVWEWVSDWHAPYDLNVQINPQGPAHGDEKVIRGGSWYFSAQNAKSSARRSHAPHLWGFSIGFRIVCEKRD